MPLSWNEIKDRALKFSHEWADESSEDAEAKSFWDVFLPCLACPADGLLSSSSRSGAVKLSGLRIGGAGGQISVPDDDAPRPALRWLSLPRRVHPPCGLAVFPVPVEPARGRGEARGISVSYETIRQWRPNFSREFANRIDRRDPAAATNGTLTRSSSPSPARSTGSGARSTRRALFSMSPSRAGTATTGRRIPTSRPSDESGS